MYDKSKEILEDSKEDSSLFDSFSIRSLDGRFFEVSFIIDFKQLFNILNFFKDGKEKTP